MSKYPKVKNPDLVGTYSALTKSGRGYVWDEVLEYRVWCHSEMGASDCAEEEVLENSDLVNDLGCDGDDFGELIDKFSKDYNVNIWVNFQST